MKKLLSILFAVMFILSTEVAARAEETANNNNWGYIPVSVNETSTHIAYKIEDGILTFRDLGDTSLNDFGKMPNYSNLSRENPTDYTITEWYLRRNEIKTVVFDETISHIGLYTLVNLNGITEIYIENPFAEVSVNAVLFNAVNRAEPLDIYAASTIKTVDRWIRGGGNRKISEVIAEPTMFFTDFEEYAESFKVLEDTLLSGQNVKSEDIINAITILKNTLSYEYELSDYKKSIIGAENIIELLQTAVSGSCGENLTYKIISSEKEDKLELHITGSGDMEYYTDVASAPWAKLAENINCVWLDDNVTSVSEKAFSKDTVFYVNINSEAYACIKEKGFDFKLDKLRILCIGNSHTADYSEFLPNIIADLKNAGMETEIIINKATIGSIGLYSGRNSNVNATYRSHLAAINAQSGAYNSLINNRYDLIIIQDYMESVVDTPEVFTAGLGFFIEKIKSIAKENGKGKPEIAWFADWVDIRSCGGDSAIYDGNGDKIKLEVLSREDVYQKSLANMFAVEKAIAENAKNMPDFVIHGSTIKQNAIGSYFGTTKIFDKNAYCILERDTTHLSYELGRYTFGAGVMTEICEHYGNSLFGEADSVDVASALTLSNGPNADGDGSQYSGEVNNHTLSVIKEIISHTKEFVPSQYIADPLDVVAETILSMDFDLSLVQNESELAQQIKKEVKSLFEDVKIISFASTEYLSSKNYKIVVTLQCGYSIKEIILEKCLFGDINLDGKVNTIDANYARRYAAGLLTLDERQKLAADVSGDGEINVMDSSLIRRYVVKYIDVFPAEEK